MAKMVQGAQNRPKKDQKQEIMTFVSMFRGSGWFKIRKTLY